MENLAALDQSGAEYNQEGTSRWLLGGHLWQLCAVWSLFWLPTDVLPYYDFSAHGNNIMAICCFCLLSILAFFEGNALLFFMCFQWGCQSWCTALSPWWTCDPGRANQSSTSLLTSAIDPGWQFRGSWSWNYYLHPLIALRWKLQVTERQTNQSILLFLNSPWSQSHCSAACINGGSSIALMGTGFWSWCSSLSEGQTTADLQTWPENDSNRLEITPCCLREELRPICLLVFLLVFI